MTPPPHDLGAGAERAWRHAEAVARRSENRLETARETLSNRIDEVAEGTARRYDEGMSRLGTRLEQMEARQARIESHVDVIAGRDGNPGELRRLEAAIQSMGKFRTQMLLQTLSISIILIGAAVVLYSRLATVEAKVEGVQDRQGRFEERVDRNFDRLDDGRPLKAP